jgi:GntR family transcriptional repressor for pyruvate dehydrogenase complex
MREALRILETRGLIQIQHGKGAFVSHRSAEAFSVSMSTVFRLQDATLAELMEFRYILETAVAGLAAARRTEDDLRKLKACMDAFACPPLLHKVYVDADMEFHSVLVSVTHKPILTSVIGSLQGLMIESREKTFRGPYGGRGPGARASPGDLGAGCRGRCAGSRRGDAPAPPADARRHQPGHPGRPPAL